MRRRYGVALAVVLAGTVLALVEIALAMSRGVAAWLYFLLLGLGAVRVPVAVRR